MKTNKQSMHETFLLYFPKTLIICLIEEMKYKIYAFKHPWTIWLIYVWNQGSLHGALNQTMVLKLRLYHLYSLKIGWSA